jgi:hypothetical protein
MCMSPEAIRARTLECIHLAQNTKDAHHQSLLLDVAHLCADLANALDRFQLFAEAADESLRSNRECNILESPIGDQETPRL